MMHPPKLISSKDGLGLNTTRQMRHATATLAISTETWGALPCPWTESGTIIAQSGYKWVTRWEVGRPYIITKIYDDAGNFVGTYCDITSAVMQKSNGFECHDMYLDIWQVPGKQPVLLDEDELEQALAASYISKAEADSARLAAEDLLHLFRKNEAL
jgi:predicted RNA-binding protein associated with RNAse of E/G family